jgi:hypothetical protein
VKGDIDDRRLYPSVIQGVTCDSRDTLETNIVLPQLRNDTALHYGKVRSVKLKLVSSPMSRVAPKVDWMPLKD